MQNPHFFTKTFYKDAKGRTLIVVDIRRFRDEQSTIELFVVPDGVIRVVTYREMKAMVENKLVVEFEPRRLETDDVWTQRAEELKWADGKLKNG